MRSLSLIGCLALALLLFAPEGHAQSMGSQSVHKGITSASTEFWLGFMPNDVTPAKKLMLCVTSETANRVKVVTCGDNGTIVDTKTATLTAGSAHTFSLSAAQSETRDREKAIYRAIRVTSEEPCTVYGYSHNTESSDGFLVVPLVALGKEYYSFSSLDAYDYATDTRYSGQFLIVAPYDSTAVTIKTTAHTTTSDNGKTIGHTPGEAWTVILMKGQTYRVQSTGWETGLEDLTGSKVTSSKPIAFLTGYQRHLIEMLPPIVHWGTEYSAYTGNTKYRVLSAEDSNVISLDGSPWSYYTLNAGMYVDITSSGHGFHTKSLNGKRMMVMHYGSHGDTEWETGSPFLTLLFHPSAYVTKSLFTRPAGKFQSMVTMLSKDLRRFTLNQQYVRSLPEYTEFNIYLASLEAAKLVLPDSVSNWSVSSDTPFAISYTGFTKDESYGYPAAWTYEINDSMPPKITFAYNGCGSYEIKAEANAGIAQLTIASQTSDTPLETTSDNYRFQLAPNAFAEDSVMTGSLRVIDPNKPALAVVYALGRNGIMTYQSIEYMPEQFNVLPEWTEIETFTGDMACQEVVIRNTSDSIITVRPSLAQLQSRFTLGSTAPITIPPHDGATVSLCYTDIDRDTYFDTLIVTGSCANHTVALTCRAAKAPINAEDADMDTVLLGTTACRTIRITNESVIHITFESAQLDDATQFSLSGVQLPFILGPGEYIDIEVCFDAAIPGPATATIIWNTDEPTTGKNTSQIIAFVPTMSVERETVRSFSIHPNPASGTFRALLPSSELITTIKAIDILGQEHRVMFTQSVESIFCDVSTLPTGTYVVEIETAGASYSARLVINR